MPNLGIMELVLILFIVLVVFGAGKLPQLGDALGRSIRNFKRASSAKDEIDVTPKKEITDNSLDPKSVESKRS